MHLQQMIQQTIIITGFPTVFILMNALSIFCHASLLLHEYSHRFNVIISTHMFVVLAAIKESQLQHGLRHGDYQRYRTYCSRRLRRIRKCVSQVQGVRQRYVPKHMTPEQVKDVR